MVIWKSDLADKIKSIFFSKQRSCRYCYMDSPHGCKLNVWKKSLMVIMQECCELYWTSPTKMLWAVLNKSHENAAVQPPTTHHKTIKVWWTRDAGHCWRSKDELISDKLQWTPSHGWTKAGRPARTYKQHLCADTGCSLEDLPGAMDDRDRWRKRVRESRASNATSCI